MSPFLHSLVMLGLQLGMGWIYVGRAPGGACWSGLLWGT